MKTIKGSYVLACAFIISSLILYVTFHSSHPPETTNKVDIIPSSSKSPLVIWSSDFHISPVADIKHLLQEFNVKIVDKSLSSHCHLHNTCATDLRVINQHNGIALSPCPNALRKQFYEYYRKDAEFMAADAILCTHATSMCELFMPFQKPLILIVSTRYEIGRHDKDNWLRWNDNLMRISSRWFNSIAANNKYDLEYVKYFTNLTSLRYLPSYCNYMGATYNPKPKKPFLLAPSRGVNSQVEQLLRTALLAHNVAQSKDKHKIQIASIRELYPMHYEYSDLARHPGIILLPYQVSFMSLFEFYRMQVPLFVPSLELLAQYHAQFHMLSERTWDSVYGHPEARSLLPRHSESSCALFSDPNDEYNVTAIRQWVQLADFYQFPHIVQFSSFKDLIRLLMVSDLQGISRNMQRYNEEVLGDIRREWTDIIQKIERYKQSNQQSSATKTLPSDVNEALAEGYGVKLVEGDCVHQVAV